MKHFLDGPEDHYLHWNGEGFILREKPGSPRENRRTLAQLLRITGRKAWGKGEAPWDLPKILGDDGFLCRYAEGVSLTLKEFQPIWAKRGDLENSIELGSTPSSFAFYGVKATPPGLLPKLFSRLRLSQDPELLRQLQSDLLQVSKMTDDKMRHRLTLAILAHGAAYRELDGQVLEIPSFQGNGLVPYAFRHHLLWEGIKTISATPLEREMQEPGLYLCQGTEIWPSQPSILPSLFANLGKEGSATEPYARCWRQIHRHLRALTRDGGPLPIVLGHSMGGALATQIMLYSHPLIQKAAAFNPPVVEERDYELYDRLPYTAQCKLEVYANLDDFPFWRIGSKVIGNVTLFLGEFRFRYRPIRRWELFLILPVIYKVIVNLILSIPAHQNIIALQPSYLLVHLSRAELSKENARRPKRADHVQFLPYLYHPARMILRVIRSLFRWKKREEYLLSQIELLELHEHDLRDTLAIEGGKSIQKELDQLALEKERLRNQLLQQGME